MKTHLALLILLFVTTACGKHESENQGYIQSNNAEKADVADTPEKKFVIAIDTYDRDLFRSLINSDADLSATLANGQTPLIYSTVMGRDYFVFLLMGKGVDPAVADASGKTALEYATELSRVRILLLLDPGQQAALQEQLIQTILNDSDDVTIEVNALLNNGVDPNFVHADGETPLTLAIQNRCLCALSIVNWKDPGFDITVTDINLPNAAGLKPLAVAKAIVNPKTSTKNVIQALIANKAEEN